jgi:DNA-binding transcriptional regulator GbsR (MarR family)
MVSKQAEITNAVGATDEQVVEANKTLEELNTASDNQVQEKRADILNTVEEELRALSASRKLLAELLSKVQEDAVTKAAAEPGSTTVTFGAQNSGFQAGVINGPISGISFGGK